MPPAPKKPRAPLLNGDRQAHKEAVAQRRKQLEAQWAQEAEQGISWLKGVK